VDSDNVLYWGLRRAADDGWVLYAARYVVLSRRIDTVILGTEAFATDDCTYLPWPEHTGSGYRFGSYPLLGDDWRITP